jgi:hypothetical protein
MVAATFTLARTVAVDTAGLPGRSEKLTLVVFPDSGTEGAGRAHQAAVTRVAGNWSPTS